MTGIDVFDELAVDVGQGACLLRPVPFSSFGKLIELVARGLFPDGDSTLGEWYEPDDLQRSARRAVAYHAASLADAGTEHWSLPLGVWVDGDLVGVQSLEATHFTVRREAATGSFLAPELRGQGIGKLARVGALHVAFMELGADWVTSTAIENNAASRGVSLSVGYRPDGTEVIEHRGARLVLERFRISRQQWNDQQPTAPVVRAAGVEGFARRIGVH